jgi:hypothetical protein
MPSTDSFTSTAATVTTATLTALTKALATDVVGQGTVEYSRRGFRVAEYAGYVTITKASSFGMTQSTLSLPITLDDARDLADALKRVST